MAPDSDDDDEAEVPASSKKSLDFGDPLAGVILEEEHPEERDEDSPVEAELGDEDVALLLEPEHEARSDSPVLLDVGTLVPSLPALAAEPVEAALSDVPASAFLQDDWSAHGDGIAPDEPGDGDAAGPSIPFGAMDAFEELGDAGDEGPKDDGAALWPLELAPLGLDDAEPARASVAWQATLASSADTHALSLLDGRLIAVGAELAMLGEARADVQSATPPRPLVSVAPWQGRELLCASAVGPLYRHSSERGFELEGELHRRLGLALDAPIGWRLSAHRLGSGGAGVAALCSNGRVLLLDADGRVRSQLGRAAVLGTGAPLTLIHPHDGSLGLRRLDESTGRWRESTLVLDAAVHIDAETRLCCHGELAALAHPASGVWVSSNGGSHFRRVPSTGDVTALAFAERDGQAALFIACASAAPAVRVLACDPATLAVECVAELEPGGALGEEREEWLARALVWDERASLLWLGASFGLVRLTPP
jgi:hypothetical protein